MIFNKKAQFGDHMNSGYCFWLLPLLATSSCDSLPKSFVWILDSILFIYDQGVNILPQQPSTNDY